MCRQDEEKKRALEVASMDHIDDVRCVLWHVLRVFSCEASV